MGTAVPLDHFPSGASVTLVRRISDRYIEGTTLRLRQQSDGEGQVQFKLAQKLPGAMVQAQQGLITTMYLSKEEFGVLAKIAGESAHKNSSQRAALRH